MDRANGRPWDKQLVAMANGPTKQLWSASQSFLMDILFINRYDFWEKLCRKQMSINVSSDSRWKLKIYNRQWCGDEVKTHNSGAKLFRYNLIKIHFSTRRTSTNTAQKTPDKTTHIAPDQINIDGYMASQMDDWLWRFSVQHQINERRTRLLG